MSVCLCACKLACVGVLASMCVRARVRVCICLCDFVHMCVFYLFGAALSSSFLNCFASVFFLFVRVLCVRAPSCFMWMLSAPLQLFFFFSATPTDENAPQSS